MPVGLGTPERYLTDDELRATLTEGLGPLSWQDQRVLVIVPDATRTAPIGRCFRQLYDRIGPSVRALDVLIALGTHPPMSEAARDRLLGFAPGERQSAFAKVRIHNHEWQDPDTFAVLGTIDGDEMAHLTEGYLTEPMEVRLNRMVLDCDRVVILGPTFPHEVVGFSGGNKYFFPGIAGGDVIDFTHWLGALHTNLAIIGTKDTPVRRVIDRAVSLIPTERVCCSLVVAGPDDLYGLYVGTPEEAFKAAADLSAQVHVKYVPRTYHTVLSVAPGMYDDLWTGGKCMYKLEPVVADGGELVIYAPHIDEVSYTHGKALDETGYHVRDYFVKQADRFRNVSGCVKAHASHVKGAGTFEDGVERPRVTVTLATRIPRERCERINLGYRDPDSIDIESFAGRENEGVLLVRKAGEYLYRVRGG